MKNRRHSSIEPLETRVAPAAVISGGGLIGTYTDSDGDIVTVKVSKGTLTAGLFTLTTVGGGEQLDKLDLSGGGFDDADLTISVKKAATGDGLVSVTSIDSTNHDLGKISIKGNLDEMFAGDATTSDGSVTSLTVTSIGKYVAGSLFLNGGLGSLKVTNDVKGQVLVTGGATDGKIGSVTVGGSVVGGEGSFSGSILAQGPIGPIKIAKDVIGGSGNNSGWIRSQSATIASVTIGGSLLGGNGNSTGEILAFGNIGPVSIKGNVIGRQGSFGSGDIFSENGGIASVTIGGSLKGGSGNGGSGQILASLQIGPVKIAGDLVGGAGSGGGFFSGSIVGGGITSLTVGGSLLGGSGPGSGAVFSTGDIGKIKIGKDLQGGSGVNSGRLQTNANLPDVTVGGSVIGSSANGTGKISAGGDLNALLIKGSLLGGGVVGDIVTPMSVDESGYVQAAHIGKLTILGSIISGQDNSAGTGVVTKSGSIRAFNDIASLTVKGGLLGNSGPNGDSPVVISARGQLVQNGNIDLAIGKLSIGGTVTRANILAGFDENLSAVNGDAQIGPVAVGGDWIASNLSAGVQNLGADDAMGGTGANADNVNFGDVHDVSIGAGNAPIATIASIQIKGLVIGSAVTGDHFGFVAQKIGPFKSLTFSLPSPPATTITPFAFVTNDVALHSV